MGAAGVCVKDFAALLTFVFCEQRVCFSPLQVATICMHEDPRIH